MDTAGKRDNLLFEASLLSAAFFLGTNPVAVKYAVGAIPPIPFVAVRFTLAGLLLLVILRLANPEERPKNKDLLAMAAIGMIGVGLNNVMFTIGVSQTTASETALIYATPPLWGMLLAFSLGLERPRLRGVMGVMVALLGVFVVVYGGLGSGGSSLAGNLLVMCGAICWGSYTVLTLRLLQKYSPLTVAAYTIFSRVSRYRCWPCPASWIPTGARWESGFGRRSPTRSGRWRPTGSSPSSAGYPGSGRTGCSSTSISLPSWGWWPECSSSERLSPSTRSSEGS